MVAGKKKERKGKKIKIKHPASYFFFLALQALFPSVLQCNYHTAVAYLGNKKASAKEKKGVQHLKFSFKKDDDDSAEISSI